MPLPPGWSARATSPEALVAGPANRTVLRIDLWPDAAGALPSAAALERGFRERAPQLSVEGLDAREDERHSLLVLNVRSALDGGGSESWVALLGAARLGDDVFLCSTVPGATEEEVKAASAACGALSRTEAPGP